MKKTKDTVFFRNIHSILSTTVTGPVLKREDLRQTAHQVLIEEPLVPARVVSRRLDTLERAERRINRIINN